MDVQLVGQQREAVVLQELFLLLLQGSAEVRIQQLGTRARIQIMRPEPFHLLNKFLLWCIKWRLLYWQINI